MAFHIEDLGDYAGDAWNGIKDAGNWLYHNTSVNLGPVQEAQRRAYGLSDQLAAERAGYGGNFSRLGDARLAAQQQGNIDQLAAAAAGRVPSPAEIQLQQQAGINAARQFGLAAALQGRNPGAALRSARLGSLATQGQTNIDAAMLRAKEQADARAALVNALQSARGQGQNLLGADVDWRKALLGGEENALYAGTRAATGEVDAQQKQAAANRGLIGDLLGAVSDRTAKKDIRPADLDSLADSLKGFRFRYKDEAHGKGERVGVMAQDVAKGGPIGKRMVNMGPGGKLRLDVGNAVGAALAMSAQALRRSKEA